MEITAIPFVHQTEVVSQKLFNDHFKLYEGYVDKTNEISLKLAASTDLDSANATYSTYRGLKRGESFALDGVILHELYFQNLITENSPIGNRTSRLLDRNWGSFDRWKEAFIASAKAARGWCILAYEQRTKTCRNILLDFHDEGLICGAYPLLALDMYEHAYMLDYGIDKATYINRFIASIPWEVVEKRAGAVTR